MRGKEREAGRGVMMGVWGLREESYTTSQPFSRDEFACFKGTTDEIISAVRIGRMCV